MNVSLPTALEEFARGKVATGQFQSVDEVVCEGLRLLQQREQWRVEAKAKIDVGWEQAKSNQLRGPEQVRHNLSSRKEAWKKHGR